MAAPSPKEERYAHQLGFRAVYFIVQVNDRDNSPCKVGRAERPRLRLSDLQVASPVELEIVDLIYCKSHSDGWLETRLHNHFDSLGLRIRGEWFKGGYRFLIDEANELLADHFTSGKVISLKSMRRRIKAAKVSIAISE
ncbi:MAG: GIY-YIG nuclease family protein [Gammaproteobacteria bacterium]|nr:GIY-YIG nuclease family protein [Gammaproteobacteria bacterium]